MDLHEHFLQFSCFFVFLIFHIDCIWIVYLLSYKIFWIHFLWIQHLSRELLSHPWVYFSVGCSCKYNNDRITKLFQKRDRITEYATVLKIIAFSLNRFMPNTTFFAVVVNSCKYNFAPVVVKCCIYNYNECDWRNRPPYVMSNSESLRFSWIFEEKTNFKGVIFF